MSKTTYGYISFKIRTEDTPDEDILLLHKRCAKEMVDVLEKYGGELTSLEEVAENARRLAADPSLALEHKSIKEVTEE